MARCGLWEKRGVDGQWVWLGAQKEEIYVPGYTPPEPQQAGQELPPLIGPEQENTRVLGYRPDSTHVVWVSERK